MKNDSGFIAITSVLVIAAVALAISVTVSLLAIGEGQSSLALFKGEDTVTFVEGCAEDALLKVRQNSSYAGGNITRPEGTCVVTVSKAGNVWTVTSTTNVTAFKRSIQTIFTLNGINIGLTSWKEI